MKFTCDSHEASHSKRNTCSRVVPMTRVMNCKTRKCVVYVKHGALSDFDSDFLPDFGTKDPIVYSLVRGELFLAKIFKWKKKYFFSQTKLKNVLSLLPGYPVHTVEEDYSKHYKRINLVIMPLFVKTFVKTFVKKRPEIGECSRYCTVPITSTSTSTMYHYPVLYEKRK